MAYVVGTYLKELAEEHKRREHTDLYGSYARNCPRCKAREDREIDNHDKGKHAEKESKWCIICTAVKEF